MCYRESAPGRIGLTRAARHESFLTVEQLDKFETIVIARFDRNRDRRGNLAGKFAMLPDHQAVALAVAEPEIDHRASPLGRNSPAIRNSDENSG